MTCVQTERVLVVPAELFHRLGHFQGFSADVDRYLGELLNPAHMLFLARTEAENDPGFKQLIPYVIFRYRGARGVELFQYTRGTGQGEGRLHRKKSIGIGGHISTLDRAVAAGEVYEEGMRRELAEEVAVETRYTQHCAGLINDDETEVGKVHLGVVHLFDVERPLVRPLEEDIIEAGFRPLEQILADTSAFESWSQICLAALFVGRGD